jgi:hypothetical protein
MIRSTGRLIWRLTLGGCLSTLLLASSLGLAQAQTTDDTSTQEPVPETSDSETTAPTETEEDTTTDPNALDDSPRFSCQVHNGQYTVMYWPESQPEQVYPWAVPQDMGSTWPAQRRCEEISARLESYRPDGLLELQTAVENGYNTVCVTTESVSTCRIVFTVPPGQNPTLTRNQVFENLTIADQGQQTEAVSTFVGGSNDVLDQIGDIFWGGTTPASRPALNSGGINLKPFLAPEDGGTGTQLRGGSPAGSTLNPDRFR